ncbi:MAG: hypothetical protein KatS3mg120_0028 [Erythrobacter sp.]|nr:MAG: hypothetical protein KatS3mg120_0028 [Erythrobacter sp.]
MQAAVFHKEIRDFFLDLETNVLAEAPITIPAGIDPNFRSIKTVINGASAQVTGIELSYSQTFPNAPGILSGLFLTGNLTLADSKAETSLRPGVDLPFPNQADITGNFSLGYEDKRFSLRGSVNYRGETLAGISNTTFADVEGFPQDRFRAAYTQYDINIRFNVRDGVQLYADAINITGEKDIRFYQGQQLPPVRTGAGFRRDLSGGGTYHVLSRPRRRGGHSRVVCVFEKDTPTRVSFFLWRKARRLGRGQSDEMSPYRQRTQNACLVGILPVYCRYGSASAGR